MNVDYIKNLSEAYVIDNELYKEKITGDELFENFYGLIKDIRNNEPYLYKDLYESNKFEQSDDFLLKKHILKLEITDTLFKNTQTKAKIFSNIAYAYLTEDQNETNNKKFIETYKNLTTGEVVDDEILKIGQNIVNLSKGNSLPTICLNNSEGIATTSESFKNQTLIFFWTTKFNAHQTKTFEKILAWNNRHPNYQVIAINLDNSKDIWLKELYNLKNNPFIHFQACDLEEVKEKWVVLKLQKTILLNKSGHIEHAFINMYDPKFDHFFK